MSDDKEEKLPLDARLLSDAVIELNISRRSVGLYPPEHPFVKTSIARAYLHLQKLFEIRSSITLGVAKDTLVIDEYKLDQRNPVFREFAGTLHAKGLAAITFSSGLGEGELTRLQELLISPETPFGKELADFAARDMAHISLGPVDYANFSFVEGSRRPEEASADIWEDYVYGLLEGRLSGGEGSGIMSIPAEQVADVVNAGMTAESSQESYDRVITAYMRRKGEARISSDAFYKFFAFVERLRPEIRRQFLSRSSERFSADIGEVEKVISEMTPESFCKFAELITENASLIPATLKNVIDKLSSVKMIRTSYFDFSHNRSAVFDDIELGEEVVKLFGEDHFHVYVNPEYQKELVRVLEAKAGDSSAFDILRKECEDDVVDGTALDIMLELLHADFLTSNDYLTLITRLSEFASIFLETGRFELILETYNTLTSHALSGRFSHEASSVVDYFFHSADFVSRVVDALRLWGRKDRDGSVRLAKALKRSIIEPLIGALIDEHDSSLRKFLLSVLAAIGSSVIPHAVRQLNDERWFVLRNMIYLIRECNGTMEIDRIRKFVAHDNASICMEALKTLLQFRSADAVPFLRTYLNSSIPDIRKGAVRLAGIYRVREVVPDLLRFLERRDLFGSESFYRVDIVRVLGEIGDVAAVATLRKLYNTRSLFYQGDLDDLKLEIFRTLDKYPLDAVKPLIHKGLGSKNEEIRNLSEQYLVAFHAGGKRGSGRV